MTGEFAFTLKLLEDGEEITNIPWPVYNVVDSMVREYRQWPGVGGKWVRRDEKWNEHGHQEGLPVGGTPIVSKWPGLSQTIQSDSEISVFFRNNQAYFVFWKPSVGVKVHGPIRLSRSVKNGVKGASLTFIDSTTSWGHS